MSNNNFSLFDNSISGYIIYEPINNLTNNYVEDFKVIYVNHEATKILKLSKETILNKTLLQLFPNAESSDLYQQIKLVSKIGEPIKFETEIKTDNLSFWLNCTLDRSVDSIIFSFNVNDYFKKNDNISFDTSYQLNATLDRLKMAFFDYDIITKELNISPQIGYILEDFNLDNVQIISLISRYAKNDLTCLEKAYQNIKNVKTTQELEFRIEFDNGAIKVLNLIASPILDTEGSVVKLSGSLSDITIRRQEIKEFEKNKTVVEEITAVFKMGTWILNLETNILSLSKLASKIFNRNAEIDFEIPISEYFKFMDAQQIELINAQLKDKSLKNTVFKSVNRLTLSNGKIIFLEILGFFQYQNSGNIIIGTFRDVTSELNKDYNLTESQERLKLIFDHNPSMYFILNENMHITSVNKFGYENLGYSKSEMINMHVDNILHEDYRLQSHTNISELAKNIDNKKNNFKTWEVKKIKKDGTFIWVKETATTTKDRYNNTIYLLLCEDITNEVKSRNLIDIKQKELIAEKEKALAAVKEKQIFVSTISHEIRTPMNAVIGLSKLLLDDNPRPDQVENISTLNFASEQLYAIVNDVLDFSKIEAGKLYLEEIPFDIKQKVQLITGSYLYKANEKQIKLTCFIDNDLPDTVIGDPIRIIQVLNNLISNSVKFTNEGQVEVYLRKMPLDKTGHVKIRFEIADSGIGIPQEKINQIFDSFIQVQESTSRDYGGTGLGLTIAKKLIELHDSKIHVQSKLGKGSNFFFDIIYNTKVAANLFQPKAADFVERESLEGLRILLVEDNAINQLVATRFLEKFKVLITIAQNGKEAIEKIESQTFDIVLMDIMMPIMNGTEATAIIRKHKNLAIANLPIIALTATFLDENKNKFLEYGMNDYISKPFNANELLRKIKNLTGIKN